MPLSPTILWAQRADRLLLTIDLQACANPKISIVNDATAKAGKLKFRGDAHSHATGPDEHAYQLDLEFYGEVDEDDIKQLATERFIMLVIAKKEPHEHWPRLLKAAGKPAPNIKVDWDKWVDEDDEEEAGAAGGADMGGFDLSSLQNFGASGGMEDMLKGMGGAGGGFEDMSDDEEETGANRAGDDDDLPGLEPVPQQ
ncbi:hypothetical protein D9Q98_003908 [Chlorella vulgaris]|uniref:CS domain-containing protein n=1 Tax=Chlorella vulgaris TaxID=3077 RepID=A0A9D4TQU8_CHLVU|nr:hypothetical protein D9Q98_003908 [Chlorella vulgaris]